MEARAVAFAAGLVAGAALVVWGNGTFLAAVPLFALSSVAWMLARELERRA